MAAEAASGKRKDKNLFILCLLAVFTISTVLSLAMIPGKGVLQVSQRVALRVGGSLVRHASGDGVGG